MFTTILLVIIGLIAVVLIYAATRPDTFQVERSIEINASPETVYPHIADFRLWQAWTPYDKDPAMKKTYGGAASSKGASYAWEGNKEVGKGDIAITDAAPPGKIEMELHMIEPFEGRNHVVFTLAPHRDATLVTWAIDGKNNFMSKIVCLFMDMNKMIGGDFEKGLGRLKAVVEK